MGPTTNCARGYQPVSCIVFFGYFNHTFFPVFCFFYFVFFFVRSYFSTIKAAQTKAKLSKSWLRREIVTEQQKKIVYKFRWMVLAHGGFRCGSFRHTISHEIGKICRTFGTQHVDRDAKCVFLKLVAIITSTKQCHENVVI